MVICAFIDLFILIVFTEIESHIREIQEKKKTVQQTTDLEEQIGLGKTGYYDADLYDGTNSKYDGYVTSIAANDEPDVSIKFH